jgi:hypothetical protein
MLIQEKHLPSTQHIIIHKNLINFNLEAKGPLITGARANRKKVMINLFIKYEEVNIVICNYLMYLTFYWKIRS